MPKTIALSLPKHKELQINAISKQPYHGFNQAILQKEKFAAGHSSNQWLTFLQAKRAGRSIARGSVGVSITKIVQDSQEDENGHVHTRTVPRHYTVFNVDQLAPFQSLAVAQAVAEVTAQALPLTSK